jgi:hypothetical protein
VILKVLCLSSLRLLLKLIFHSEMLKKAYSLFRGHQSVSLQKFQSFWFAFAVIRLSGAVTLTPDQASSCP